MNGKHLFEMEIFYNIIHPCWIKVLISWKKKKQLTDPKLLNSSVFKNMFLINLLRYSAGISAMLELPKNFIAAAMDKEIGNTFPIKRIQTIVVFSTNMKRFTLMVLANLNFKALLS